MKKLVFDMFNLEEGQNPDYYKDRVGYDSNKSLEGSKNSETINSGIKDLLKEFPEYNAGWTFEITNVGVIIFKSDFTIELFVYYDLLEKEENEDIDKVNPDNRTVISQYTDITNPFNYRIFNFNDGNIIPDRKIIQGNIQYIRVNADYLILDDSDELVYPDKTGWFQFEIERTIKKLYISYKQTFLLSGNILGSEDDKEKSSFDEIKDFCISKDLITSDYGFNCSGKTGYLEVR